MSASGAKGLVWVEYGKNRVGAATVFLTFAGVVRRLVTFESPAKF